MAKRDNESYQDYRERVLNPLSPTFCSAKWYNSTIWLGNGMTASCHHPPAHHIPIEEVKKNHKAIHNTEYKKMVREQMLRGERPKECDYCWRVEDLGPDKVSDRVYKSVIYDDEDQWKAVNFYGSTEDVSLKTLEIAFDSNCNFGCSYCNASFSTTWMTDIKMNGPYQHLVSDGGGAFQQDGSWAIPFGKNNSGNPYVGAFMKWWEEELQYTLTELRITGGEATMSPDFWKLVDWWEDNPDCEVRMAVNTNLGTSKKLIDRLCKATHSFKSFDLYTSNESYGAHAEYIRDGLVWGDWLNNLAMILSDGNIRRSHIMLTINALCLMSLTEFMDEVLRLKKQFGREQCSMSFNILRFPSFQSVVTLPQHIKLEKADRLEEWIGINWDDEEATPSGRGLLSQMEHDGIKRLISYLREVQEGHDFTSSLSSRERDFKSFYGQYDKRRGKSFSDTFPELMEWYDDIPETHIPTVVARTGTNDDWTHVKELKERAKEEGWVLDKSNVNPGSKDYTPPEE